MKWWCVRRDPQILGWKTPTIVGALRGLNTVRLDMGVRISEYEKWFLQDLSLLNLFMNHFFRSISFFFYSFSTYLEKIDTTQGSRILVDRGFGQTANLWYVAKQMAYLFTISELVCALSERDCLYTNGIWSKTLEKLGSMWVAPRIACELLVSNLGRDLGRRWSIFWHVAVQCIFWSIWLERNSIIFDNIAVSLDGCWEKINFRVAIRTRKNSDFKHLLVSDLVRDWSFICVWTKWASFIS